jgi:hypothetical protein
MASPKKGTGQPLLEREKLAIVRYCEDVNLEKPNFLTKEIWEKAARIFDVLICRLNFYQNILKTQDFVYEQQIGKSVIKI